MISTGFEGGGYDRLSGGGRVRDEQGKDVTRVYCMQLSWFDSIAMLCRKCQ